MRIGVIWVSQETSTFNPSPTTKAHFESFGIQHGQEIFDSLGTVGSVGGYLRAAGERPGVESVPIFKARAGAGGRLDTETFEYLAGEVERGLRAAGRLDGLALQIHGACSADGVDDVDGHFTRLSRQIVGPDVPIVLTLDHHANITRAMVEYSDAMVGYRTQPHDPFETGYEAAHVLFRIVAGEVSPATAFRKIPLLSHQEQYLTSSHPMKTWFDRARAMESEHDGVITVSTFPMQPWLDVEEGGWSVVVYTDGDQELADGLADELGDLAWSLRGEFQLKTSVPVAEAVARAEAAAGGVVVLSDTGDSVLGGAGGDSTVLLREMLETGIAGPALVPLVHPGIGGLLDPSQLGSTVTVEVGGAVSGMYAPISLTGVLRQFGPTTFQIGGESVYAGFVVDLGVTAVLDVACGTVVVTQRHGVGGVHPDMYRHYGIDPADFKMAVLKTASNFQYFSDMASETIRVDTPGPTQSDIGGLPWTRIPRPVYPLDEMEGWR
ncbi:MAG TPA: M81 family metallopeptidase [Acidimicrobiia bacterium]|nr:M81 family metallopeptidase [Acidimicrobiia bacterium]